MNFFWCAVLICVVVSVLIGIKVDDILEGIEVGFSNFLAIIMFSVAINLAVYSSLNGLEEGIQIIVNSGITNEQMQSEIESLIVKATEGGAFDIVVDIVDSSTEELTIKDIKIKIKHPVILKCIYVTSKKNFTMYIDNNI